MYKKPRFDSSIHIVQTGETVYAIAWRHKKDYRDVIVWNGLSEPYTIYPGQKLTVRIGTAATVALSKPSRIQPQPLAKPSVTQAKKPATGGRKPAPVTQGKPSGTKPKTSAKPSATQAKKPATGGRKPAPAVQAVSSPNVWVWPIKGRLLTRFSASVVNRQGIEIKGAEGAEVLASRGGQVVYSGSGMSSYYGSLVIIKHSETYLSAYAHNDKLLVAEGDKVKSGQPIARLGVNSKGVSKLRFEVRRNGDPVNPLKYLPK